MKTYVALLRGINVGGHKKVPMADLRELMNQIGLQNVKTYIQSGNVIFQSNEKEFELEEKIQRSINSHFGFDVAVVVKSSDELLEIFNECPFEDETKQKSYFIVLNKTPETQLIKEVENISHENEAFIIKRNCIYFYSSIGFGQTKFNMTTFERKLKVKGTSRNFNTMLKLLSLCAEI